METINKVENIIKGNLDVLLQKPFLMAFLKVFLVLYASKLAPTLPTLVSNTFSHTFIKVIAIALIAYLADVDFQLAIILSMIFVLSTNLLSGRGILESYENQGTFYSDQTKYTNLLGKPAVVGHATIMESQSDNYPGCNSVTMADLLSVFDGDHTKLQQTVQSSYIGLMNQLPADSDAKIKLEKITRAIGLPYNVELTEKNAPIIATLLINANFIVNNRGCAPPS